MKKALITGITGQDGSYLSELLLAKGYEVHGIKRRISNLNTERIDHNYSEPQAEGNLILHYGDLSDSSNLVNILERVVPDEVYNLGAQSHVATSFEIPEYTANVNGLGSLRLLEGIRLLGLEKTCRFYQASSSELFGLTRESPQSETTSFYPRSPYAISKLFAYWATINYREAYRMFACNGILFNHESKRRGETFVTRKISNGLVRVAMGLKNCLYLGNLDSTRDWGHAKEYVEMQWMMLQTKYPKDYVISTGRQSSVRDFVNLTAECLGFRLDWQGKGTSEVATIIKIEKMLPDTHLKVGDVVVKVDPRYYRPTEVDSLLGDSTLAHKELGWAPQLKLTDIVNEMVTSDLADIRRVQILKDAGFSASR